MHRVDMRINMRDDLMSFSSTSFWSSSNSKVVDCGLVGVATGMSTRLKSYQVAGASGGKQDVLAGFCRRPLNVDPGIDRWCLSRDNNQHSFQDSSMNRKQS